jgi:hypothetical protein
VTEDKTKKVSAPKSVVVESPSHPTQVTEYQTKKVSAPRSVVVDNPSHPEGVRADQTKKDQPYSSKNKTLVLLVKLEVV